MFSAMLLPWLGNLLSTAQMDTLEFGPRAFHMQRGSDAIKACAPWDENVQYCP